MRSDLGFALIAVNFRKYTACEALHGRKAAPKSSKKVPITSLWWLEPFFYSFQLVMSQPLYFHKKLGFSTCWGLKRNKKY